MGNVLYLKGHPVRAQWVFNPARLDQDGLGFEYTPSFSIGAGSRVLVMGSCFAYEIALALNDRGIKASDAGVGLQYNAPSMLQLFRWALDGGFDPSVLIDRARGLVCDPCCYIRREFDNTDDAIQTRTRMHAALGAELSKAGMVVLTFGLVEAWWDDRAGVYLNVTPPHEAVEAEPGRYQCRQICHAENHRAMLALFKIIRRINAGAGIIATVSPVPLAATFCGPDVLIANAYSKATLRSALDEAIGDALPEGLGPIDYFPSYELATLSDRGQVWRAISPNGKADGRHVKRQFVKEVIVEQFCRAYVEPCLSGPARAPQSC